jgi:type VI secretion system protein VasG
VITQDIRVLLGKLNQFCTKTLESSVGNCVGRTHYQLTWEHLLMQFIDSSDCDVFFILRHYSIETAQLQKAITKDLEELQTGNTSKPTFSPTLIETVERAWSFASLIYGRQEITSGILFASAMEDLQRAVTNTAAALRSIDPQKLKTDLLNIITASSEQSALTKAKEGEPVSLEALEKYCKNFTQEARDGKIDLILGRDPPGSGYSQQEAEKQPDYRW